MDGKWENREVRTQSSENFKVGSHFGEKGRIKVQGVYK